MSEPTNGDWERLGDALARLLIAAFRTKETAGSVQPAVSETRTSEVSDGTDILSLAA
jgi:hypothetical protein